jgi:uncharacterized membrane protein
MHEKKLSLLNLLSNINTYWQYHYLFLLIGMVFGLQLVFINPPWHTNDEDRHFYNAYSLSQGHIIPEIKDNQMGHEIPSNLVALIKIHQTFAYQYGQLIPKSKFSELEEQILQPNEKEFCPNPNAYLFPFPYFPAAIMIKIGMLFKDNPIWIGWWARIGSLFAYLILIFCAIKIIPHYKSLLMLIALSPMALFQGASVTYDTLNLALIFLLFAYLIKLYFQESPVRLSQILLYCLIVLLHRLSKDGYFILYFSILALGINRFEKKAWFYVVIFSITFVTYMPNNLWNNYLSTLDLPYQPLQSDFSFNGSENLNLYFKEPSQILINCFSNFIVQGKLWLSGTVGRFGFSYTLLPDWFIFIHIIMYIIVIFFENSVKFIDVNFKNKLLLVSILNVIAIIYGFLIYASPVGAKVIYGLQGRYFLPILPFLFLALFYVPNRKNKDDVFKWIVPLYLILALSYTIYFFNFTFYVA